MYINTESLEFWSFVVRLLAALLLGAVVGLDREVKNKPAGINTFILVSVGAAAYTMVTIEFAAAYAERAGGSDPTRLVQGLVGGIGFLGAGAIIGSRGGGHLRGIGTGALIWLSGSIGIACGLGLYVYAAVVAVLSTLTVLVTEYLQLRYGQRDALVEGDEDANDRSGS